MGFETIYNFYENLVSGVVQDRISCQFPVPNQDFIDDVTCLALNQLPSRYVRHTVDLLFYMSPDERAQITSAVNDAVNRSIQLVTEQADQPRPNTSGNTA